MIGLIRKDLLLIKRGMGSTLLILAFLVILFNATMGVAAGMAIIPISFAMMVLSTFIWDDTAKWDAYALCTPMAKRSVVLSKYLTSAILVLIGAVFSTVAACISLFFQGKIWSFEVTLTFFTSVGLSCFMSAILLPLAYRFGAERARVILMICIFVPICLAALMKNQFSVVSFSNDTAIYILAVLPIIGMILLFPSYFISKAIYMQKDF